MPRALQALAFLKSGLAQTLLAANLSPWPLKCSFRYKLFLPDQDRLLLEINKPQSWKEGDRVAMLVHGLSGSSKSNYMIRLTKKIQKSGVCIIPLGNDSLQILGSLYRPIKRF